MMNLNNAPLQYALIPKNTIAKVMMEIQPADYGEGNLLTKSKNTGSIGLSVQFTILDGEYKGRKIKQLVGIEGTKRDEYGNDKWADMGQTLLRAILESAHNIDPKDESERATKIRDIKSYKELDRLICLVKIGIEVDKTGKYNDKNKIGVVITPNQKDYRLDVNPQDQVQPEIAVNSTTPPAELDNDEIPF
jgi:hypothetical protein